MAIVGGTVGEVRGPKARYGLGLYAYAIRTLEGHEVPVYGLVARSSAENSRVMPGIG